MIRPIRTEPEAAAELDDAALWYEKQRAGLGIEFLEAVDRALIRIAQWPQAGALVPDVARDLPVRRAPVGRFPYHVVYLDLFMTVWVDAHLSPAMAGWLSQRFGLETSHNEIAGSR